MRSLSAGWATDAGIVVIAGAALAVRIPGLAVPDLAQAEHHKLEAVAAWRAGDLIVDGEHPALFKGLVFVSTRFLGETAAGLRTPSVIAGAVSCVLVALIGRRLLGATAGWAAGGLMALGTLPVGIDRVGKEDAVMVALVLAAVLCWLRSDEDARWWVLVAAFAGAAVAVKYEALPLMPALWLAGRAGLGPRAPRGPRAAAILGTVFLGVHLALNPLLLLPEQWAFLWDFTGSLLADRPPPDGSIVPTHGFAAAGEILAAKPVWYYGVYLVLKAQPLWVAAVGGGAVLALLRRRREDVLLLTWAFGYLMVISVVPFGYARYMAPALPALALLGGAGVAWFAERAAVPARPAIAVGAVALAVPLALALPYPALYVNALGGGSARALHWSPDDAGGNLGMTRAVAAIASGEVDGGVGVADPTLVRYLSGGRLHGVSVEGLAADPAGLRAAGVRAVVVQPSQVTLGNRALFDWLARGATPGLTVRVRGLVMVRVYRIGADGEPCSHTVASPTRTALGNRTASRLPRPGIVANARPTTTTSAERAARSTAASSRAPLPTRTSEASIVSGIASRPVASGTSGRSLTTASAGALAPRTAAAMSATRARSRGDCGFRPRTAPGRSSSTATPAAATAVAWRGPGVHEGAADAASTAIGTERRAQ